MKTVINNNLRNFIKKSNESRLKIAYKSETTPQSLNKWERGQDLLVSKALLLQKTLKVKNFNDIFYL